MVKSPISREDPSFCGQYGMQADGLLAPDTSVSITIRWTSHSCTIDQKLWTVLGSGPWAAI